MLACGARLAEPGEFTRRAFFNGKMALHAAAAVADIIDAQTRCAARAALANFESGLAQEIRAVRSALATILQELEGAIDFPDEVPEPGRSGLKERLAPIRARLERLARDGELGRLVREGLGVAIVGPPNAGKSSLLNALLGYRTRDRLRHPGNHARYDRGKRGSRRSTGAADRYGRHPIPRRPLGGAWHRPHRARARLGYHRPRRRRRLATAGRGLEPAARTYARPAAHTFSEQGRSGNRPRVCDGVAGRNRWKRTECRDAGADSRCDRDGRLERRTL